MYKQGDILVVPFPYSNLSSVKNRPVLVMSNERYNANSEDVVICAITSNPKSAEYSVPFGNEDLAYGAVPSRSRIKADKLFAIEKSQIRKSVARVSDTIINRVKDQMLLLFGF